MHPGRCAAILLDGRDVGVVGELHPRWRQAWELPHAPMLFELDLDAVVGARGAAFEPVPRFQPAERDLAVIVADRVTHDRCWSTRSAPRHRRPAARRVAVRRLQAQAGGAGMAADEKSMAVRLTLASPDATLTDDQIEAAVRAVVDASPGRSAVGSGARMGHVLTTTNKDGAAMEFTVESLETPALTKAQLAELLFEQIGLNKRESKDMIDAFFDLIAGSLVDGQDVKISGFGNFQIRTKAPRPGRNPRTGEAIPIQARRVVTFHASHKLKEQIQGNGAADSSEPEHHPGADARVLCACAVLE
jgi:integration host factor subunit alpha